MSELNRELIEYYKNLLIMQYRDKIKALGHVDTILTQGMIYDISLAVRDGFNIETAVGAQQDVLGRILGVSRTITGTTFTRAYYGYALYGDTSPFVFNRMLTYGESAPDVQFRNYTEGEQSLYDLTDEEYRVIQKLAIVRNMSNASVKSIDDIITVLFGAECYFIDRMNMTVVSYMVGSRWSRIFGIAKSEGLLPNPAGVGTSLVVVPDIDNIFSYSLYGGARPDFAVGYGRYLGWNQKGELYPEDLNEMTTLSETRIAGLISGPRVMQAYDFDGAIWFPIGNQAARSFARITSLSSTRIAGVSSNTIITYDFDGTDWVQIGNDFIVSASYVVSLTTLSEGRIAAVFSTGLQTYDFDGVDWSPIGNILPFTGPITALSPTRIAAVNNDTLKLETYDFDGTDWTLLGNGLDVYFVNRMTTLSDREVAFVDENGKLQAYSFDGTDWTPVGVASNLGSVSYPQITALSETRVAININDIQAYDFIHGTIGCMASYT